MIRENKTKKGFKIQNLILRLISQNYNAQFLANRCAQLKAQIGEQFAHGVRKTKVLSYHVFVTSLKFTLKDT